jgi:hypothetical protein
MVIKVFIHEHLINEWKELDNESFYQIMCDEFDKQTYKEYEGD